jgi:hypothetical protein
MDINVLNKLMEMHDKLEDRRYRILFAYSIDGLKDAEFLKRIEQIEKEEKQIMNILVAKDIS